MANNSTPSSPIRTLVVDDDADTVTATALLLQQCGFEVWTARDGITALTLAEEAHLDLILLDLGMPKVNGYAVVRALQQAGDRAPLLVALTGYGRHEDLLQCAAAGFDLHLVKPVPPAMLTELRSIIERGEGAPAIEGRLGEERRHAICALLRERLKMAEACMDIATHETRQETKDTLISRALHSCEAVGAQARVLNVDETPLLVQIASLRYRISVSEGRTEDPDQAE